MVVIRHTFVYGLSELVIGFYAQAFIHGFKEYKWLLCSVNILQVFAHFQEPLQNKVSSHLALNWALQLIYVELGHDSSLQ